MAGWTGGKKVGVYCYCYYYTYDYIYWFAINTKLIYYYHYRCVLGVDVDGVCGVDLRNIFPTAVQ